MADGSESKLLLGFGDVVQFRADAEADGEEWGGPCVVLEVSGAVLRVSYLQDIGERAVLGLSSKEWGRVRKVPGVTPWTLEGVVNGQAEFATHIPGGSDEDVVRQKHQARGELAVRLTTILAPLADKPPSDFLFSTEPPADM